MEIWTVWIIVALLLAILEVVTQMMWALCLTIGALGALVCSLIGIPLLWQIVVMSVVAIAAYAVLLPRFKRWHSKRQKHEARTGMDALLGRRAVVTETIYPDRIGRARIDGDNWQVKAPGVPQAIPEGSEVIVTAYDSIILTVELH